MKSALLEMHDIRKSFGATKALDGVSLSVDGGEVIALIGENGAGKSTLMKILSGAETADAGTMTIEGRPYTPSGPHDALTAGVAMIYQELNLAPDLSVEDNIMLGQENSWVGLLRRSEQRRRVAEVLNRLGHPELELKTLVSQLSIGAQQLVEIARALVMQARVIVFDEPTSSLTRHDVARLFTVIRSLCEDGIGIVYISHFLEEVQEVAKRYTVLRDGESVGTGLLADASEQELVRLMVNRDVDDMFPCVPHDPGDVHLHIVGLSGRSSPEDVSLELRRGEILGITGLVGAGRTELLRCLFALDEVKSGRIKIGSLSPSATPNARIRAGLGLVSEDRKGEGLAQTRSIADNMTYSRLSPYSRGGWLRLGERRTQVEHWMDRLRVKARSPEQSIVELSGGNQQKVAIARVLHQEADVLLLDEPTRGIDIGTKAEIYRLIGELAAAGKAVIFVSSYFTELLAVCDRVAVMSRGRLQDVRGASEWTEETILSTAIGTDV
ncbi:MAG: sugar ABC transporter ATP-binding protein [Planctomycetaceae bacterium]|nr:sugar ABC transporter ATP-binding protein [Planctomycetaceae bacterium]